LIINTARAEFSEIPVYELFERVKITLPLLFWVLVLDGPPAASEIGSLELPVCSNFPKKADDQSLIQSMTYHQGSSSRAFKRLEIAPRSSYKT